MKLVDANVLLYAANTADPHHEEARRWLDGALSEQETVGFAWLVLTAFLRLATKPGLFPRPLKVPAAMGLVRSWTECPCALLVEPTSRHLDVLAGLLGGVGTGGNLVSDAHLAALAAEHDATVITYDNDFDRFPGVRWHPPS
ncbi:PIN domain-containing protein [Acidiferrimicrobium sp. IK]|uniref:TA system VapC family ribonuclease toxin n=1 Tax=Acidiferrimicrobium sp. IK TaxID=2871700 RepID=UPI0021CAEF54|nr:TA system VapC family ribonuclease toxin [Acidiferrimicrobium sp. IK]MCU4186338.1 PIN domain-containing protein [Acidiferrimicrobium sp. IK]